MTQETTEKKRIYPSYDGSVSRDAKERRNGHRGHVFWLFGLSGSGKSTLAYGLERLLHRDGVLVQVLDGDNVRTGLNSNLGFSDEDRCENIRRIAEVAKLFVSSGNVVIVSFITPKKSYRELAKSIVGEGDFTAVYVNASFEACAARDVKGLYAKAKAGEVKQFTGKDSVFEPAQNDEALILNTEASNYESCLETLTKCVREKIQQENAKK